MDDIAKFSIDESGVRPGTFTIHKEPIYICPKHGEVKAVIVVDIEIKELNGFYCSACWIEKLIDSGVCRVEEKV